jgi:hypothetical protein
MQLCNGTPPTCTTVVSSNAFYIGIALVVVLAWVAPMSFLAWRRRRPGSTSRPAKVMSLVVFIVSMVIPLLASLGLTGNIWCLLIGLVPASILAFITYGTIESGSPESVQRTASLYTAIFMFFYRLVRRVRRG